MNFHPISTFVLILASALITNVATAQSFSVSQSVSVSGATSGSGTGSGTATLDTVAQTLTLNITTTTATGFTNTTSTTEVTISGVYAPDSLSGVSGYSQLISCINNGGLVNGCNSITNDFGSGFLTDPINFDLSHLGVTTFSVSDSNSGATINQTFTLITGGSPPVEPPPPVTIDLTSGGPQLYSFDPGDGSTVSLTITPGSGSVTQGSSGLGTHTAIADDNALDNYWSGSTRETLIFTFSEPMILGTIKLDLFEPLATSERAELSLDGGGIITIDENNATRPGADLSNWDYVVDTEVTTFSISTPTRGAIGDTTFRVNSLIVSALPPVDSDGDGLTDDVETNTGVFVDGDDTGTDPNNPDSDGDGVLDGAEVSFGTDPNDSDTDDDGVSDGAEIGAGTDPTVSQFPCDVDPVAGLTAGDLLLLQRHVTKAEELAAHEQVFCDLNYDSKLTAGDMLLLQKQVLEK